MTSPHPVRTPRPALHGRPSFGQHHARVRVPTHIRKLDDAFGQFPVRVICDCSACRVIDPEALARLVGLVGNPQGTRAADALLEVRQEGCRGGGSCQAQTARCALKTADVRRTSLGRGVSSFVACIACN
jgi:hypothetical protein